MTVVMLHPKNLTEQVVDALGRRIVSGFYKQEEKLSVESELCSEYGVSRSVMRESNKILSAKGLISVKPRRGTIVKKKEHWNLLDADVLNWTIQLLPENEFLDMLFEVRMAMEPHAAALAAQNATEDDIRVIGNAYNDMASAKTPDELTNPDIRFHQAIMDATHNDMLSYIGRTLHNALEQSIKLTSRHPNTHALSLPRHEALYIAIKTSNPDAARDATIQLLQNSRDDFDQLS